ncbi:MAG: hypothetical protein KDB79_04270, partial [Acidobacteria bacterium]|nr:hypothetical protein [Acidobacteriota bacterium]
MNIRTCSIFLLSLFIFCNAAFAVTDTNEILKNAVSTDEAATDAAIKSLREMRQDGLNALLAKYQNEIDHYKKTGERSAEWQRIARAIDRVAMQKDAYASGLYWYTDLNEAKTYAQKSNKPILSLRLLGQLSEEYSCANSRFFRSILYSNSKIASYLRENYVLHWKSVRPAPKVTIDFGDGRKIVRTITGNSIHYILNSEGKIIDALPGLYSPNEFIVYLARVNSLQNRFSPNIRSYQTNQLDWLTRKWNADSMKIGLKTEDLETPASAKPTALEAAPRAVTKSVVESPLVRSITIEAEAP